MISMASLDVLVMTEGRKREQGGREGGKEGEKEGGVLCGEGTCLQQNPLIIFVHQQPQLLHPRQLLFCRDP